MTTAEMIQERKKRRPSLVCINSKGSENKGEEPEKIAKKPTAYHPCPPYKNRAWTENPGLSDKKKLYLSLCHFTARFA